MGAAGTRIKDGCVEGDKKCGTHQQGFISSGTHPTILNQRATLSICFKGGSACPSSSCYQPRDIEVINCGSYFVYNLTSVGTCGYAYCSE